MGWSASHISCQHFMTFTPAHQQILIDFSIFVYFFLTVSCIPFYNVNNLEPGSQLIERLGNTGGYSIEN